MTSIEGSLSTLDDLRTDADMCRARGWGVGTVIEGSEGGKVTRIQITAIGRTHVLAVNHDHEWPDTTETLWTLRQRDWKRVHS